MHSNPPHTTSSTPYDDALNALTEQGLLRQLKAQPLANEEGLNLSSNDYLNLARHPELVEAAKSALDTHGCSARSSRLVTGNLPIHEALEQALATFCNQESALVFPSGFQTNLAVLSTLASKDDLIFSDALNHASIIDGARLSKAQVQIYRHNDTQHLQELLESTTCSGQRFIITDSVFSMDGDLAPLNELSTLAETYNALLLVDEAHGLGVFGEGGGVAKAQDVQPHITIGTLSKALGSGGGFIACANSTRDYFINKARPFIYSTGLSPANAAAGLAAINLITSAPTLGHELLFRSRAFEAALINEQVPVLASQSQVIPVMVGDNHRVQEIANALETLKIQAVAIRPPTVPVGSARIRLSVTLEHSIEQLMQAAQTIGQVFQEQEV